MSLIELLMATGVFLAAGACSLQLWASSARAAKQLGAEQRLLLQMDGHLLRLRANWLQAASRQAKPMLCRGATEWMLQDPAVLPPPAGLTQRLIRLANGQGVAVVLRSEATNLERRRVLTPAALGFCDAKEAG